MEMMFKAGRAFAVAGMLFLAVAALASAIRILPSDAPTALVFGLLAPAYFMSGLWSVLRGPQALIQAASTMLAVHLVAFLLLRGVASGAGPWQPAPIHTALLLEGLVLWALLLGAGCLFAWEAGRRDRIASPAG